MSELLELTVDPGSSAVRGNLLLACARMAFKESLAEWRALGRPSHEGSVLHNLGVVAHGQEDYLVAKHCFDRSLSIARSQVYRLGIAEAKGERGDLALDLDDLGSARSDLRESLLIHRQIRRYG